MHSWSFNDSLSHDAEPRNETMNTTKYLLILPANWSETAELHVLEFVMFPCLTCHTEWRTFYFLFLINFWSWRRAYQKKQPCITSWPHIQLQLTHTLNHAKMNLIQISRRCHDFPWWSHNLRKVQWYWVEWGGAGCSSDLDFILILWLRYPGCQSLI